MWIIVLESLIKVVLAISCLMGAVSYLVLLERRMAAWIQDRWGPNRVGIPLTKIRIWGLGQPIADGVKFIFKEEVTPDHVNRPIYFLAPMAGLIAALTVFAVIPYGSVLPQSVAVPGVEEGQTRLIHLTVAPGLDVGMIYVFAVSSIAVYGVVLGSWASNNKYALLGGLRSVAQLISYEIPLGLGLLGVVLMTGSLRLDTIIGQQADAGVWNAWTQPLGFVVFMVAAFAESGRLPFDLGESEQELVGGFHTEYSGMKLMMYLVSEFLHMIAVAFLVVILFFGGWHFWGITGSGLDVTWLQAFARVVVLLGKVLAVILFFMIARWSWPRFRFDQVMSLAWKVMIPLGLVNLVVVATWIEYGSWLTARVPLSNLSLMAGLGWTVLIASWFVVTLTAPATCDNRPRLGPVTETRPGQEGGNA